MYQLYQHGIIKDFPAGEDIYNNSIYVIDEDTHEIRRAKNPDEYLFNHVVLVYNPDIHGLGDVYPIKQGTNCRCWVIRMVV